MAGDANATKGQRLGVSFAYLSTVVCYRREVGRDQALLIEKGKTMEEQGYNGWTNRETWATALHIDNDQGLIESALDYARTEGKEHSDGDFLDARNCLAESLEGWITEDLLTLENISGNHPLWLMLTDIGSLYRVNWRELAEHYLDQVKEEVTA